MGKLSSTTYVREHIKELLTDEQRQHIRECLKAHEADRDNIATDAASKVFARGVIHGVERMLLVICGEDRI